MASRPPVAHVIDAMRETDVASVAALEALSFPTATTDVGPTKEREGRLREELARPWSHAWVVRDASDRAIAFLLVWHVADEIHVLNVATHPSHRRRGIGRSLVDATIEFARAKKATHVRLEVRRSNESALRMYRPAGFFVVAIRKSYYPDGEDAIDMDLLLDPGTGDVLRREDETRLDA
jgi:[ribosomal protein S18]-alanine N-acetyltransferase